MILFDLSVMYKDTRTSLSNIICCLFTENDQWIKTVLMGNTSQNYLIVVCHLMIETMVMMMMMTKGRE